MGKTTKKEKEIRGVLFQKHLINVGRTEEKSIHKRKATDIDIIVFLVRKGIMDTGIPRKKIDKWETKSRRIL
jgi:hypothetical protein